jgi:hypothetical protein
MRIRNFLSPALVVLVLSPMIGELLCGSAPPAEFFNPLGFVMLTVLYGGGAILVRELTHRWGKGWPTLITLGAAYGIAEEGLMCKSFFDPNWMDLGPLGTYGRCLGVNWVWSLELTIYHTVFSIAIPILLVSVMFPAWRDRAWISGRKLVTLFVLWVVNAAVIFFFISPYRPPVVHYLLTVALTVGLCVLAWQLPRHLFTSGGERRKAGHTFWFLLTGFLGTFALFFLAWIPPNTTIHAPVVVLLMAALVLVVGWIILRLSCNGKKWSVKHQLALAAGALGFFILMAPLQELDKNRTDNTAGMTLVGLTTAIFLLWLARRARGIAKSKIEHNIK